MNRWIILAILSLAFALAACSGAPAGPRLTVEDAWARPPAVEGGNGAIYFRLVNEGRQVDTLLGVSSPVAAAEMHQSVVKENGTMGMEPMGSVVIPAGGVVELKQGGMHVMLIGVDVPMPVGESVSFTLQFENAGDLQFTAEVRRQ